MTFECNTCEWYGGYFEVSEEFAVKCPVCGSIICTLDEAVDVFNKEGEG